MSTHDVNLTDGDLVKPLLVLALLAAAAWYYRGTWAPEVIEPETATPAD